MNSAETHRRAADLGVVDDAAKFAAEAPPLSDEQLEVVRAVFRGAPVTTNGVPAKDAVVSGESDRLPKRVDSDRG